MFATEKLNFFIALIYIFFLALYKVYFYLRKPIVKYLVILWSELTSMGSILQHIFNELHNQRAILGTRKKQKCTSHASLIGLNMH